MRISPEAETFIHNLFAIIVNKTAKLMHAYIYLYLKMKHHDTVVVIAVLAAERQFPFVHVDGH